MTAGPSAGPASAYPTFSTPASICFSGPNDVFVPGLGVAAADGLLCCRRADQRKLSGGDGDRGGAKETAAVWVDLVHDLERLHWRTSIVNARRDGSAEREGKDLHARTEKLDLELAIDDGLRLPDQLVQTLLGDGAVALFVNVNSVSRARRLSIDQHAKSHGRPGAAGPITR